MSYGRNCIRVDPYWWEWNPKGNLYEYFDYFWKTFLPIESCRLHWGKHKPKIGSKFGKKVMGPGYMKLMYPKFEEFMKFREQMDPD